MTVYGSDSFTIDRLLKRWKEGTGGYETRYEVIEGMISNYGPLKTEAAIDDMIVQQATSRVGVDAQIKRVQDYLAKKGKAQPK